MERRDFLKKSAVLGASTLTGCCATSVPIDAPMLQAMTADAASGSVNTFLAPLSINNNPAIKLANRIVDPHAHIYNATDWQVEGGLEGPFAYSQKPALRRVLQALAKPIEKVSQMLAISASDEMEKLNQWALLDEADARLQSAAFEQAHNERIAELLFRELEGAYVEEFVNDLIQLEPTIFTGNSNSSAFSPQFLLDAYEYSLESTDSPQFKSDEFDALGLWGFVFHMLSPRFKNLKAYRNAYSSDVGSAGIDQCYASVLDFDYWIGDCDHPPSRLQDQVILMARISQLSGGYMRPLVAYNPWTDIEDNEDSINLVKHAVMEYGFVGVKIYNQLGYYPSGNCTQPYPDDGDHPDLCLLDAKLEHFFEVCRQLDIPVMTHSGDSMGRLPSHNKLGGPAAWERFYQAAGNSGTRVNLAHMGSDENGPSGATNWTAQFTDVMKNSGTEYLYGDCGMWRKFTEGDIGAFLRLINLLNKPVSNGETVADRVMFGTDWLMLSFAGAWRQYPGEFMRILQLGAGQETMDKIMFRNADRFFKVVS